MRKLNGGGQQRDWKEEKNIGKVRVIKDENGKKPGYSVVEISD